MNILTAENRVVRYSFRRMYVSNVYLDFLSGQKFIIDAVLKSSKK